MMLFQADEHFGMSAGHFDSIFVGQGVAHAGDWKREGTELLRVLRSGRRMVLAELSFSKTSCWNLEDVAAPRDAMDDLETIDWRGVDLLWGRRP